MNASLFKYGVVIYQILTDDMSSFLCGLTNFSLESYKEQNNVFRILPTPDSCVSNPLSMLFYVNYHCYY